MPLSYVAVLLLVLLAIGIGRRGLDTGLVPVAVAALILIAAFSVAFLITFCMVVALAWSRHF
jgi:hypothetical protein